MNSATKKPVNVLVVDDSPDSLLALETLLAGLDRKILTAQSGEAALKHLLDADVGVILLDVKMTGLDGFETAALIRQNERTRNLPIIFMTAYHQNDADIVKGYAVGAADYVFKPIIPEVLRSKVNCFVELAHRTAALQHANDELRRAKRDLGESQASLERRVQERTAELAVANRQLKEKVAELEKFQDLVVGRELKMAAQERELTMLRERLRQLENQSM